jgi:hypothetical protein
MSGGPARAGGPGRPPGAGLLRLYPRVWRERYEDEFLVVLGSRPAGRSDRFDIARGALDAHLHPARPSIVPAAAALLGGGLWITAAGPILALPAPPDWPGYLLETLPLAVLAVVCLTAALVGLWLRLDGRADRFGRRLGGIGLAIGLAGQLAWIALLLGAFADIAYGAPLAAASTVAGLGTVLVGLALGRAGDWPIAGLLVVAPVLLVIPSAIVPSAVCWIAFGLVWSLIGLFQMVPIAAGRSGSPAG